MGFPEILTKLRYDHEMTQREFSDKVGIPVEMISMYELGKHNPDPDTLIKIAKMFNVTTDYLLGNTPIPADKMTK